MTNRINDLNALEQSRAELAAGVPMTVLEQDHAPKVALLGALAWQHHLRGLDPKETKPTFETYMAGTDVGEIVAYLFGDLDEDVAEEALAAVDPFPADDRGPAAGGGEVEGGVLPDDGRPTE